MINLAPAATQNQKSGSRVLEWAISVLLVLLA